MSAKTFIEHQLLEIQQGGRTVLFRKMKRALQILPKLPWYCFLSILAVPVVLVIRLIRPLVWIRFGTLRSDVIGHSVFDAEYYLSEREVENGKTFDCFYFQSKDPFNEQWSLMERRHLITNPLFRYLDKANQLFPGGEVHQKVAGISGSRDRKGYLARTKPHFSFLNEENLKGLQFLESLGVNSKDRFACLIVRDSAYKEKYQKWGNRDWSYHNYRDCDIDTFAEAAIALAEKGYWVFRMGKAVHKPFKVKHQRVIDYANSAYRSDFLDIWLMANCFFCISTGTGLDEVSRIFRRPAVYVNFSPFSDMVSYDHAISVPKHLVWKETNGRLTLSEHFAHSYYQTEGYENAKILVKDLSAEEIRQAVQEMEARLNGTWKDSKEDNHLQNRFWEILKAWSEHKKYHGRIHPKARVGAAFLKKSPKWLD